MDHSTPQESARPSRVQPIVGGVLLFVLTGGLLLVLAARDLASATSPLGLAPDGTGQVITIAAADGTWLDAQFYGAQSTANLGLLFLPGEAAQRTTAALVSTLVDLGFAVLVMRPRGSAVADAAAYCGPAMAGTLDIEAGLRFLRNRTPKAPLVAWAYGDGCGQLLRSERALGALSAVVLENPQWPKDAAAREMVRGLPLADELSQALTQTAGAFGRPRTKTGAEALPGSVPPIQVITTTNAAKPPKAIEVLISDRVRFPIADPRDLRSSCGGAVWFTGTTFLLLETSKISNK